MKFQMIFLWIFGIIVISFLILPLPIILPMSLSKISYFKFPPELISFKWYQKFFLTPTWITVVKNTLIVSSIATVFSLFLGTLAALALTRAKFWGHNFIVMVIMTPMVLSPIVLALGQYQLLASMNLIGTKIGLGLLHTVLVLPFVFVCVATSLQAQNPILFQAAEGLGAGPIKTFFLITLPLITPGIISAAIFAFMISFDELVLAIYVSGVNARTLPLQIWDGVRQEVTPEIAVASTFILASYLILFLIYGFGLKIATKKYKETSENA